MAVNSRQNNLFAAEDWAVAYQAYSQVDFQAYDFDTIRNAMVEYIKTNFPENFNDYTESSEFIAIIELLAYLGQSIAFRMDVNTRENFLETAERRDSVFKLARQLGYNPKRNIPASGLMKIVSVATSEPLTDSSGSSINDKTVSWNDSNNPDSYEQFLTILNSAFGNVNRFSKPVKTGTVGGIMTDRYDINTPISSTLAYSFSVKVNGINRSFEFVNVDFEDSGVFSEKHPDPTNNFSILHRNDGLGSLSKNTGFFMLFKQGILSSTTYDFTNPIENRQQDIGANNINEHDVYLSEIDNTGSVLSKWVKVPNTVGQTLMYNTKAKNTPLLYAVQNLGTGGIRLQFADGNFANVPMGSFVAHYRVSDNERFVLQPDDVRNVVIVIPYLTQDGKSYSLTVTLRLENAISNSLPAETLAGIKERAPQAYYAQDRMVTAQDYQVLPLAKSTNIKKLKVTNKTHAGHSRYIDITDPTSTFQTTTSIAEDGALYEEASNSSDSFIITTTNTTQDFINTKFPKIIKNLKLNDFIYSTFRTKIKAVPAYADMFDISLFGISWNTLPRKSNGDHGYMSEIYTAGGTETDVNNSNTLFKILQPGYMLKFYNPTDKTMYEWAKVISMDNNGVRNSASSTANGPVKLNKKITNGWKCDELIVILRKTLFALEESQLKAAMASRRTFGVRFMPSDNRYYIIENNNLSAVTEFSAANTGSTSGSGIDASWILKFNYVNVDTLTYRYDIEIRGTQFVFESLEDVRFYNVNQNRIQDNATGLAKYDSIELPTLNIKPSFTEAFSWVDTDSDLDGDRWYLSTTGSYFTSIPLISRNVKHYDVQVSVTSNFGLYQNGVTGSFVLPTELELGTSATTTDNGNVVIVADTGVVNSLPTITIPFSNTTFGGNILDGSGRIKYRYNNADYTLATTDTAGLSPAGDTFLLLESNTTTQTGKIKVNLNTRHHYAVDNTTRNNRSDAIAIKYVNDNSRLEAPIVYSAIGNFSYPDGYTDPKKVKVTPVNTASSDSPDNPIQFEQFVGTDDIILFENYEDFDGYTYTRPVKAGILDLRKEYSVNFSADMAYIAGASIGDASVEPRTGVTYATADYDYFLVRNKTVVNLFNNTNGLLSAGGLHNKKVYAKDTGKVFILTKSSTDLSRVSNYESSNHFARKGRSFTQNTKSQRQNGVIFKWTHVADNSMRIDPSVSNVHEFFVLTATYWADMQAYIKVPGTSFPTAPTSSELENEFAILQDYKSASDQLVFKSGRFKLIFGTDATDELQAKFKVVRLPGTSLSDNEIKTKVVAAINRYFDIDNWDFGDTFYFTELSSYIHQQVGNAIGSIVIVPTKASGVFGDLFQVKADPDELFLSTAGIDEIDVVDKLTHGNIKPNKTSTGLLTTYNGVNSSTGPYAISGYYPLYATAEAANFAGDGTSMTHTFFGQIFYMPNGVTYYHGTYVLDQSVANTTLGNTITLNNSVGNSGSSTDNSGY
mgnify:CR=1 FL=1|tara:strand:+ start:4692 stop:9098 length:4407 start_codon:yes stop_codon:yes gene_type:complete